MHSPDERKVNTNLYQRCAVLGTTLAGFRLPNPFTRASSSGPDGRSLWVGDRLARYLLVGASGVVVNLGSLLVLVEALTLPPLLAAPLAIEASILWNYTLNRHWTWGERGPVAYSLGRYHGVSLAGMLIQWLTLAVGVQLFGIHYLPAAAIGIVIAAGWTFLSNDRFTFNHSGHAISAPRTVVYPLALAIHLMVAAVLTHSWDTFVFQRTVSDLVQHGLTPYTVALQAGDHTFLGRHLPITQHWYAYPPVAFLLMTATYFPAALGYVDAAWAGRVLIKLPAILATLGLAAAARHLVATAETTETAQTGLGPRVERWILFNPLFVLIAAVWGQLEALILVLLVFMVIALRARRWVGSGALWGLSLLVKPFAVLIAPVIGVHLFKTEGWPAVQRFFTSGILTAAVVCIPFFLMEPVGFLRQSALMHMERPPARFAPLAVVYYLMREGSEAWPGILPDPAVAASWVGLVSLFATLTVLTALFVAATRRKASETNLLLFMGLSMLGALLTGKVLNEQYFLLPLGLMAVWWFHPASSTHTDTHTRARWFLIATTWGVFLAALTERAALLHFIPDDIMHQIAGTTSVEAFATIAWSIGLTIEQLRLALGVIAVAGLLVCYATAIRLLWPKLREGAALAVKTGPESVLRDKDPLRGFRKAGRRPLIALAVVLLVALPLGSTLLASPENGASPLEKNDREPQVFAYYKTHWYNPTHDPLNPAGDWSEARITPLTGYYNLNAHKVTKDLQTLHEAGVDGVLIALDPMHLPTAATVRRMAEAMGMPYAVVVDLDALPEPDDRHADENWLQNRLQETVRGPALAGWAGPNHLRDPDTDRPIVLVRQPVGDGPGDTAGTQGTPMDVDTIITSAFKGPMEPILVNVDGPENGSAGEQEAGNTSLHDAHWITGRTIEGYVQGWQDAIATKQSVVIVWNGFDQGVAIEPTREHQDEFLSYTRIVVAELHGTS